jgi:hypothetical protein
MRGSTGPWPVFHEGFKQVGGPYFMRGVGVCGPYFTGGSRGNVALFQEVRGLYFEGVRHPFFIGVQGGPWPVFHGGLRGLWPVFNGLKDWSDCTMFLKGRIKVLTASAKLELKCISINLIGNRAFGTQNLLS